MFSKDIEFSCPVDYFLQKEDYPVPSTLNIPDWFKKLNHDKHVPTVKGCMPFLDTLKAGYLLKMPQDMNIRHNIPNPDEDNKLDTFQQSSMRESGDVLKMTGINLNSAHIDVHPNSQLEGCPLNKKNSNLPFHKILNPWTIKTPPGYSCLFVPPLNNADDRFSIIPGIVDTDTFNMEINFPIVINGDKYPSQELFIKKGTPYVQVIPFKRDDWKMKVTSFKSKKSLMDKTFFGLTFWNRYRNKFWSKKTWK
tara:strand:- start:1586 stop:2338 length:753 start_codon:yes stop_codon:yes gene_type:complete